MPDQPLTHRELADLNLQRARTGAGLTDYAGTAVLHYLAHIADVAEEIRDHVAFLAGPEAQRQRDEADLAKPDPAIAYQPPFDPKVAYAPVIPLRPRDDSQDLRTTSEVDRDHGLAPRHGGPVYGLQSDGHRYDD